MGQGSAGSGGAVDGPGHSDVAVGLLGPAGPGWRATACRVQAVVGGQAGRAPQDLGHEAKEGGVEHHGRVSRTSSGRLGQRGRRRQVVKAEAGEGGRTDGDHSPQAVPNMPRVHRQTQG